MIRTDEIAAEAARDGEASRAWRCTRKGFGFVLERLRESGLPTLGGGRDNAGGQRCDARDRTA